MTVKERKSLLRVVAWTVAGVILLIPFLAMRITGEVVWSAFDFIFFGALVIGVGLVFELVVRKTIDSTYRMAAGVALATAFTLIWLNGAVGIIGNENNKANLMYGGVLAVGLVGSIIAKFKPPGMARALAATAFAQALVTMIALIAGLGATKSIWPLDLLLLNGFFVTLWLISAWLFRKIC